MIFFCHPERKRGTAPTWIWPARSFERPSGNATSLPSYLVAFSASSFACIVASSWVSWVGMTEGVDADRALQQLFRDGIGEQFSGASQSEAICLAGKQSIADQFL